MKSVMELFGDPVDQPLEVEYLRHLPCVVRLAVSIAAWADHDHPSSSDTIRKIRDARRSGASLPELIILAADGSGITDACGDAVRDRLVEVVGMAVEFEEAHPGAAVVSFIQCELMP